MVKSQEEMLKVLDILEKTHGETMLEQFKDWSPFQITVATLLSARSKDATVIPIVKRFFSEYPGAEEVRHVPIEELEKWFFKIGFYKTKARHVHLLSEMVIERYDGKIPQTMGGLLTLPGVGRKTANCVLAYAFGIPAIATDVHVFKISNRLGWVNTKMPKETEFVLMEIIPKNHWVRINKLLVDHGQRICGSPRPKCESCSITKHCKFYEDKIKNEHN